MAEVDDMQNDQIADPNNNHTPVQLFPGGCEVPHGSDRLNSLHDICLRGAMR